MLTRLHIEDFALVDNLDLILDAGFNVLTGETGAGKSIIVGAIAQLLGEKADKGKKEVYPELELVRLAIPRRVYTASHLQVVAEALVELHQNRGKIRGLRIVRESPFLRHFTAQLEEI